MQLKLILLNNIFVILTKFLFTQSPVFLDCQSLILRNNIFVILTKFQLPRIQYFWAINHNDQASHNFLQLIFIGWEKFEKKRKQ